MTECLNDVVLDRRTGMHAPLRGSDRPFHIALGVVRIRCNISMSWHHARVVEKSAAPMGAKLSSRARNARLLQLRVC